MRDINREADVNREAADSKPRRRILTATRRILNRDAEDCKPRRGTPRRYKDRTRKDGRHMGCARI